MERRPRIRLEGDSRQPKQDKFQAELAAVGGDIGVDPVGVGLQGIALLTGERFEFLGCDAMPAEGADEAVTVEGGAAEDLGQPAGADAPPELHLPEPILRVNEPLGKEQVVLVGGIDVGDSQRIAVDLDRLLQAGRGQRAAGRRELLPGGHITPNQQADRERQHNDDQDKDDLGCA